MEKASKFSFSDPVAVAYRKRRASILSLRARGWTYERIAKKMRLTRQRINQIVNGI